MNLLVVSHTPHYLREGQVVGWGSTVREIDHLAGLFEQVTHLAVLYDEEAPRSCLPYRAKNVSLLPVRPAGGEGWRDKVDVLLAYPDYWKAFHRALAEFDEEDVIHVRCPANISMLAVLDLALRRKFLHRWVKYAGNWKPDDSEPGSYSLQRWFLERGWHRGTVTVNGKWPDQKPHIFSFINPSYSQEELCQIQKNLDQKKLIPTYSLMFVGRVETPKGVGQAIEISRRLAASHIPFHFDIFGDGPKRTCFEQRVQELHLQDHVLFHGWQSKAVLQKYYQKAHFLLLPSTASEGWPKVLSEGMAYGAVPLAGAVSSIPQILKECGTGMALDPTDIQAFTNGILSYIQAPQRWKLESYAACRAASRFTYEAYVGNLREMFGKQWGMGL